MRKLIHSLPEKSVEVVGAEEVEDVETTEMAVGCTVEIDGLLVG